MRVNCPLKCGKFNEAKDIFVDCLNSYQCVAASCKGENREIVNMGWMRPEFYEDRLYEQFFTFHRRLFEGKEHLNAARMLHDWATCCSYADKFGRACRLFCRSLEMSRRLFGEKADHKLISFTLYSLAGVMKDQRMLVEAGELYMESLEMDRRLHGIDVHHWDIATTLRDLGGILLENGVLDEAERVIREFLAMKNRMDGGEDHDEYLRCLYELADKATDTSAHVITLRLNQECLVVTRKEYIKFPLNLVIATQKWGAHCWRY